MMLNTDNRQPLLAYLRPPLGYHFDRGFGTTFTLDLLALLVTPLALALVDFESLDDAVSEPLVLLESLRRLADRLTIFCEAGRIAVPARQNLLYSYLEQRVVEVQARFGGVFHPKVWLLRYLQNGQPPYYRLLNLTRNLTFDRSWDLALQLEGVVDDSRQKGLGVNKPLVDFINALPTLCLRSFAPEIQTDLDLFIMEVNRVRWEAPAPFENKISFHPSGIPGYRTLDIGTHDRVLIISPFLQDNLLQRVGATGNYHVLISRIESLDNLKEGTLRNFKSIFTLDEDANPGAEAALDPQTSKVDLAGLHAKLFIQERGWNAEWLIGSANATEAAFRGHNVEFMVRLHGKRSTIGINKTIGAEKDDYALLRLLQPYRPPDTTITTDVDQEKALALAEDVLRWLARISYNLTVQTKEDGGYILNLVGQAEHKPIKGDYIITCWPISLMETDAHSLEVNDSLLQTAFSPLSLLALTGFIAFRVRTSVGKSHADLCFVLNLPVIGMPPGRDEQIVGSIISNREQFLRYLRLILSHESGPDAITSLAGIELNHLVAGNGTAWNGADVPLLENLIRTISRAPQKIERIADLIEELQNTPEGQQVIPAEFMELWQIIMQWREQYHEC